MELLNTMMQTLSAEAIEALKKPLDKEDIKQRDGGFGKKLNYVDGPTVINKLNEAFGYSWSFEVVSKEIITSVPKLNKKDNKLEEQPPYVEVLGRLTVPGIGAKEQYGTKILLGGASEQEGASKSAATDALKKCATLMGIGLELYEDTTPANTGSTGSTYNKGNYNNNYSKPSTPAGSYQTYTKPTTPAPAKPAAPTWAEGDIKRLKELKAILGIADNTQLNPFVKEFTGNADGRWEDVTPANISSFNKFLEKKAENA